MFFDCLYALNSLRSHKFGRNFQHAVNNELNAHAHQQKTHDAGNGFYTTLTDDSNNAASKAQG